MTKYLMCAAFLLAACGGRQEEAPCDFSTMDLDGDGLIGTADLCPKTPGTPDDSDGDGLPNRKEVGFDTDPCKPDTDGDLLTDFEEVRLGLDPLGPDTDGDGQSDSEDFCPSRKGMPFDNDDDGMVDGIEAQMRLDLCDPDSDKDGLIDSGDPCPQITDCDNDGLSDPVDICPFGAILGPGEGGGGGDKLPTKEDQDADGLSDEKELRGVPSVWNPDAVYKTNPCSWDTDNDGMSDYTELNGCWMTNVVTEVCYSLDPTNPDTDHDGEIDGSDLCPIVNGWKGDNDRDGLLDYDESERGGDPCFADSDGDGMVDGQDDYPACYDSGQTRGSVAQMIVDRLPFEVDPRAATPAFSDVPRDHPNAKAISILASVGIVRGFPDGTFKPDRTTFRSEAAAIVMNSLIVTGFISEVIEMEQNSNASVSPFRLKGDEWYADYVYTLWAKGFYSIVPSHGEFGSVDFRAASPATNCFVKDILDNDSLFPPPGYFRPEGEEPEAP